MTDTYFLIFGIIVSAIGISLIVIYLRDVIYCRENTGAIISNLKTEKIMVRGSTVKSYCPEFVYTVNGRQYSGTASFTTPRKDKYKVGEELAICYCSRKPEQYRIKGKCKSLIFGLLIAAVGLLFVCLYFI